MASKQEKHYSGIPEHILVSLKSSRALRSFCSDDKGCKVPDWELTIERVAILEHNGVRLKVIP